MFYNLVWQTRCAFRNRIVAALSAFVAINGLSILVYTLGMRSTWVAAVGYGLIVLTAFLTLLLIAAVIEGSVRLWEGWVAEVGLVVSTINVVFFLVPRLLGVGMWLPASCIVAGIVVMGWRTFNSPQTHTDTTNKGNHEQHAA